MSYKESIRTTHFNSSRIVRINFNLIRYSATKVEKVLVRAVQLPRIDKEFEVGQMG